MNNTQKGAWIAVVLVLAIVGTFVGTQLAEKYRPAGADYRYDFVDTNPARRTSNFLITAPLKTWKIVREIILTRVFHCPKSLKNK